MASVQPKLIITIKSLMNNYKNAAKYFVNNKYLYLLFFSTLIAACYTAVVVVQVSLGVGDFMAHAKAAAEMFNGERMPPHFLYQILIVSTHKIFNISFTQASFITVFLIVFLTFISAFKGFGAGGKTNNIYFLLGACFLLISHPVGIVFPYDHHLYHGYIASNVYHSPSQLLLKLVAIWHFILLFSLLIRINNFRYNNIVLLAALSVLTLVAKPNYMIALLPALFGLCIVNRREIFNGSLAHWLPIVSWGVAIPSIFVLICQYTFFYGYGEKNSIGIGVFEVFLMMSKLWMLIPKLLASILFPIALVIAMRTRLTRKIDFQLSSAMLGISLVYSYFLVDNVGGSGTAAGNFWWSAQISHFLLLFVCIKYYINFIISDEHGTKIFGWKATNLPLYAGAAQFAFGLVWLLSNILPRYYFIH